MEVALLIISAVLGVTVLVMARRQITLGRRIVELEASRAEIESDILRKSEGRRRDVLESFFHALGDACLIVDHDLRIVLANDKLRPLMGTGPPPAGRKLPEVISDHRFLDLVRKSIELRAEVSGNLEHRRESEDGVATRYLAVDVKPVKIYAEAKDSEHVRVIIRDVTAQRETEQIRKDFVANASHELRTPLSIINGYIENLLDGTVDDPELRSRVLNTMKKHGDRIARIVEDMLTISKFESTDDEEGDALRRSRFDCLECVREVVSRLAPVIESQGARVEIDVPGDDRMIAGDRFYWDQVFFNLIENALKENRATGLVVEVILRRLPDGGTRILVRDNGVGIPRADLPFVFKRFYRVAKHHSKEVKGTGLGLSIVKRAVEAHGGSISLTSSPGTRTEFEIVLPPG